MHHSDMGGHGDMDMGEQCSMNMLFTFSTENLCIVFRQWRVTGPFSLLLSILAVILLTAGYEAVRDMTKRYEASSQTVLKDGIIAPPSAVNNGNNTGVANTAATCTCPEDTVSEETGLLLPVARNAREPVERKRKMVLGVLYAVQVFYSFFIMLLFMTYNGWIMLSVAVGAFVGYMSFSGSGASKSVSCH